MATARTRVAELRKANEPDPASIALVELVRAEVLKAADDEKWRWDLWFSKYPYKGTKPVADHWAYVMQRLVANDISIQPDCNCETVSFGCECGAPTRWRCTWGPHRGESKVSGLVGDAEGYREPLRINLDRQWMEFIKAVEPGEYGEHESHLLWPPLVKQATTWRRTSTPLTQEYSTARWDTLELKVRRECLMTQLSWCIDSPRGHLGLPCGTTCDAWIMEIAIDLINSCDVSIIRDYSSSSTEAKK